VIEDKYLEGIKVPPYDHIVSQVVDYPFAGGGNTMRIGVENEDGIVYRVVATTGMGVFMHVVLGMQEAGFADVFKDTQLARNGLDCRFQPTAAVYALLNADVGTGESKLQSAEQTLPESDIVADLVELADPAKSSRSTDRIALVAARLGQGQFRKLVCDHWGRCAVTGADQIDLLRASHIKPWSASTDTERLDPNNGLLLSPNLDAAFDQGLVSFDDAGVVLLSVRFSPPQAAAFHIERRMRLNPEKLTEAHRRFLAFHRAHVLQR
jgi:hypothetical protein